jgi:hypothetical protein
MVYVVPTTNQFICNCQRTLLLVLSSGFWVLGFNPELRTLNTELSFGGGERVRTDGLLRARQALSQLSYTPVKTCSEF